MSSDTPSDHACLRVFASPKLAHAICTLVPKSTNVSLLRTCRLLFCELRRYVWESTDAVIDIVSMIPGSEIIEFDDGLLLAPSVMRLPTQLDLSRLSIYASFVKNLEIPIDRFPFDDYENWDDFLVCAQSTPLLPNLEHIRIDISTTTEDLQITGDSANWISTFWSPSLLSFEFLWHPSGSRFRSWTFSGVDCKFTDLKLTHRFLHEISRRSPRIESLELFPADFDQRKCQDSGGYTHGWMTNLNYSSPSLDTCTAVSQLLRLRALSTTSFFLDNDVLLALAQLPLLESLSIRSVAGKRYAYATNIQLPEQSFPSLRHLQIGEVNWETIQNLLHQKSIWRGLCTLQIEVYESYMQHEPGHEPHIWSSIISSCADYGAALTSLSLSGASWQIVTPRLVDSLKQLPLTMLTLPALDGDRSDWIDIVHGLPLVEDLTISLYVDEVLPSHLCRIFASMPRLSRLSLPTGPEFIKQIHTVVTPPQPYSLGSVYFETNFHLAKDPREDAEAVARFLFALRPNMTYGPGSYTPAWYQGYHSENPMNTVIINGTLSRLREGCDELNPRDEQESDVLRRGLAILDGLECRDNICFVMLDN